MSSAGAGDSGQRSHDQNAPRRDGDGSSSLDSERVGPTTLQGLLRRLGADLSDIFPGNSGSSHSRLQQLRNAIANPDNTEQQLEALSDLCEFLSVGTEESMVSFSVNLFVGPLVNLLRTGANIEVKIYSARALTHMMEALPSSSSAIAINGAAGPLCENLLTIEYIDLAEQSLSALHKLSVDYPQQIVSANGFQAVLSFIDFFSIGMQRLAASTACNLCRSPRSDAMDMISSVLPTMMQLLDSDDRRIRESAVVGFTRLAEAFRSSSEKLETLCGDEGALIEKVLGLIVPRSPPAISPQSYSSGLRLLALLSRGSPKLGLRILATEPLIEKLNTKIGPESSGHEIDCLHLADSLLPEICDSEAQGQSARTRRPRRASSSAPSNIAVDAKRREELEQNKGSLRFFGQSLFVTLMKFYVSSADANARRVALSVLSKFIALSSSDVLSDIIEERNSTGSSDQRATNVRFCPFAAGLLGENSTPNESLIGLGMAASTLQKLPALKDSFFREGVVHEIVRLAKVSPSEGENVEQSGTVEGASSGNGDSGSVPTAQSALANIDFSSPESIWVVVSSLQRGTLHRIGRSDISATQSRPPSRALPEFRMLSSVAIPILVSKAAQSILKLYLGANADCTLNEDVFKNNSLGKLTEVCKVLSSSQDCSDHHSAQRALQNLVKLLTAPERLTIFEISRSGTLSALFKYLSSSSSSALSTRMQVLLKCLNADRGQGAFSSLVQLSLGVLASEEKLPLQVSDYHHGSPLSPVSAGLRHLSQPFKLRLRKALADNGGTGLRDYAHHVVLIEPLATMASVQEFLWPRVREAERPSTASAPPVTRRRSSRGERAERESAVLQDNDSGGVDQADPTENQDNDYNDDRFGVEEMLDMEDENQDEDAVVEEDEEEHNSDGSDDEASSGDEDMIEHDAGESDDNENEGPDSMDVDHLARFIPPFELDHDALGQAPARSASLGPSPGRGGSASRGNIDPSRQDSAFRSYAAALAANIQRSSGNPLTGRVDNNAAITHGRLDRRPGRRNPSSPKLIFSLNGKTISHDCSILSAVIQANSPATGISPRLWSDVHVLVYGKAEPDPSDGNSVEVGMEANASTSGNAAAPDSTSSRLRRSQRLQEHRERSSSLPRTAERRKKNEDGPSNELLSIVNVTNAYIPAPREVPLNELPSDIGDIIGILRHMNWIYRRMSAQNLMAEGVTSDLVGLKESTNVEFLSHKISAKMVRQLSDPVALCGGVIPEWCFALARDASFLMPFETRRILFQSTSLGVPRALHSLQTRTDMSGAGNAAHRSSRPHREEAQVGRLQRQKVRVHRHRILESAIKVMNYYSTHSTVLEVQYFDEAGTGLGPTLEFYTMASRELQRVDLRLWRANTDNLSKQKEIGGSVSAAHRINKALNSTTPSGKGRRVRRPSTSSSGSSSSNGGEQKSSDGVPAFVVPTGRGLFPSCLPIYPNESQIETNETTTALFGFVGRLLGKAMVDGRLVDLRLSETFSRLLLSYCRVIYDARKDRNESHVMVDEGGEDIDMSGLGRYCIDDELENIKRGDVWKMFTSGRSAMRMMEDVDVQLASSLKTIVKMINGGEGDSLSSLCLTFVLPGDDNIELIRGGANIDVTGSNADEFVRRVVYHVLFGGVYQQVEALLRGFGDLIDVTRLLMFESGELELLSCGPSFEKWSVEFLVEATRCDHGYSHESTAVLFFLQILSELDHADQQKFVLFTTGSPALPLGGLRNLHPKLTIVRRAPEAGRSPDECLPTVMTCTNYFKLPDYSSYEVAKKQVMYAVREGQRSFHLS